MCSCFEMVCRGVNTSEGDSTFSTRTSRTIATKVPAVFDHLRRKTLFQNALAAREPLPILELIDTCVPFSKGLASQNDLLLLSIYI